MCGEHKRYGVIRAWKYIIDAIGYVLCLDEYSDAGRFYSVYISSLCVRNWVNLDSVTAWTKRFTLHSIDSDYTKT